MIENRIRENIIRDYGNIQSKDELERHIVQHQERKGNLFENYIAKYFPKYFFKDKSVLEIGCGFGGNIIHLNKNYNLPQKLIFNMMPKLGDLIRSVIYKFQVLSSIVVIIKK